MQGSVPVLRNGHEGIMSETHLQTAQKNAHPENGKAKRIKWEQMGNLGDEEMGFLCSVPIDSLTF